MAISLGILQKEGDDGLLHGGRRLEAMGFQKAFGCRGEWTL